MLISVISGKKSNLFSLTVLTSVFGLLTSDWYVTNLIIVLHRTVIFALNYLYCSGVNILFIY